MQNKSNKQVLLFIIAIAICKIFFSAFLQLGNDESYYFTYALQPQLNYFDHPPIVGLLIRLSTLNLHFINDVTLRLGAIICCAIASWFVFKTTLLISTKQAALFGVLIYNFSVYTGVIAGFFILPDSPQMPLWCGALYLMCLLITNPKTNTYSNWLLLGLTIGLATLCKIHSLYLWGGLGLFILFYKRDWLFNIKVYLSFIVTAICCLPILIWNIQNNFITYNFHSKRVKNNSLDVDSFLREIVGEALYQNPIIYFIIIAAIVFFIKKKNTISTNNEYSILEIKTQQNVKQFLFLMSVPMIFLFWYLSLHNEIFPHWSGPGFIALYILASIYVVQTSKTILQKLPKIAGYFLLIVFIIVIAAANFYPSNFGKKEDKELGAGCPTLDISGWKEMSEEFKIVVDNDVVSKKINNPVILINKWFPACQFQLYIATKTKLPIVAVGNLEDVHQFAWLNKIRPKLQLHNDAYCIIPSNQYFDINEQYKKYFEKIEQIKTIEQIRGGKVVRHFYIYKLTNCIVEPEKIL